MNSKSLLPALGSLLTLGLIFFGCKDYGSLANKTKKVAQDLIEQGRKVGVLSEHPVVPDATPAGNSTNVWNQTGNTNTTYEAQRYAIPRDWDHVAVGTFNIQVLGAKKVADTRVMDILVRIIQQFDLIAIQEFRSKDQTVLQTFLNAINANGARYQLAYSGRLGTTSSKEQYLYLYDTNRIELVGDPFVVPDQHQQLHREPFVCHFRTRLRQGDPRPPFTFALANVHTDPDVTTQELAALSQVYAWLQRGLQEDDVIMLGDFNEPPSRYGQGFWQNRSLRVVLDDRIPTNTRGTKAYDNMIFDISQTPEFAGQAGVLDMHTFYGLTREQALAVSDHQPVWATFRISESVPNQQYAQPSYPVWQGQSR